jgi:glycosyltransferase involved in cell wall biosynthesis
MAKPRILFSLEVYQPYIAGSGVATRNLATGLARRGYAVAVMCPGEHVSLSKMEEDGVTVYRVGSLTVPFHKGFKFAPFAGAFAGKIFDEFKPDIVHLADHFSTSLSAFTEAQKRHLVAVGTNHFHPDNLIHYLKLARHGDLYRLLEKYMWELFAGLYNSLNAITVPTRTGENIIREAGIMRPIRVISNGIDLEYFHRQGVSDEILSLHGIPLKQPIVLSVGRLEKEKRPDVVLESFRVARKTHPATLVFAGKGSMEELLKQKALRSGISDSVVFTGFVPDEHLKTLYEAARIFISASEVEMQGLSIMEAMAYRLPVVASDAMAIPELVLDGENGFIFPRGDSWKAALGISRILVIPISEFPWATGAGNLFTSTTSKEASTNSRIFIFRRLNH